MLIRSRLPMVLFTLFVATVALTACGQDSETEVPRAVAPTAAGVSSPEPSPVAEPAVSTAPAPAQEPTRQPEPVAAVSPSPSSVADPAPEPAATQAPEPPASETPAVIEGTGGEKSSGAAVVALTAAEELPTVEVVKILTPSVVQIVTEVAGMGFMNNPNPQQGVGTGVVLDTDGNILTNNHVVAGAQRINATFSDGRSLTASVIGTDPSTDLAIIRVEAEDLVPAMLGESAKLQVGQDVIAIGHALGLSGGPTVSKGVVSALGRSIDTDQQNTIIDLIQTDTSINPGNSGGPLVNNSAEVIGINTAIIQGSQGIGFAINIDDAKVVASQLMDQGFVRRGFIGITPINLTPGIAMQIRSSVDEGVLVVRVYERTAAADAGLLQEDIIIELGGELIRNTGELAKFLLSHEPGETVAIVTVRDNRRLRGEITLGDRPN